jgi:hypothetical protein
MVAGLVNKDWTFGGDANHALGSAWQHIRVMAVADRRAAKSQDVCTQWHHARCVYLPPR